MKTPIYLLGFMASGKTSMGKKLAKKLSIPFFDLDHEIESRTGKTISQLFKEEGEKRFRELESDQLKLLSQNNNAIISLGGGTPCSHKNIEFIRSNGTSLYLKRSNARLLGRLRQKKAKRPLVAKLSDEELKDFIDKTLTNRAPFYEQATIVFDADENGIKELIDLFQ